MTTARIIQFGEDSCHRLMVLAGAGYSVERCGSVNEIESHLRSSDPPDALVITDELGKASRVAGYLANVELSLPVILFADGDQSYPESVFDLVIPALTSPSRWLSGIEETIQRSRRKRSRLNGERHPESASQSVLH
jgi:hypothetical protein